MSVRAALARVADVVEDVVAPDAEVRELDPLTAVRVLHPHVAPGPADAVARSPVVVAGAEVRVGIELEALAVRLDPSLLAAEAVVARNGAHGAAADDDAGAQLAEDGPLRIEPVDLEGDREVRAGGVRSGVEAEPPMAEGLDDLEAEGTEPHVHAVVAQLLVGPHGRVPAAHVDDREGLRGAEVRVEGEADHHQEVADLVLTGEPDSLVGLGVGRPHHADRIGRVVDEELIEPAERRVLGCGRVGGGAGPLSVVLVWVGQVGSGRSVGSGMREHSTLAPWRPTSRSKQPNEHEVAIPSTHATRPSSCERTTTTSWRGCGQRTRCMRAAPAFGW